jgi:hypothetical protein
VHIHVRYIPSKPETQKRPWGTRGDEAGREIFGGLSEPHLRNGHSSGVPWPLLANPVSLRALERSVIALLGWIADQRAQ